MWVKDLNNVTVLAQSDAIEIDTNCLGSLYAEMGAARADAVVCTALEDIANGLSLIERSYYRGDAAGVTTAAKTLAGVARKIGLFELAQVASSVVSLTQSSDQTALAASLARLVRMGDRSLTAIWEVQDLNGAV